MIPNTPAKRFKYIVKLWGDTDPRVVLDTFIVLSDTVGIEYPYEVPGVSLYTPRWTSPSRARGLLEKAIEYLDQDPRMQRRRRSDPLWPWIAKELVRARKELDDDGYVALLDRADHQSTALELWQSQNRIDLGRWSLADALDALETFEVEVKDIPQGEIVYEWPDGWTVQQLSGEHDDLETALQVEGEVMQHCIGQPEYLDKVDEGRSLIYSLRDPRGRPHATIEIDAPLSRVVQIQGKQNSAPIPEYQDRVDEFLHRYCFWLAPVDELTPAEEAGASEFGENWIRPSWEAQDEDPTSDWSIRGIPPAHEVIAKLDLGHAEIIEAVFDEDAWSRFEEGEFDPLRRAVMHVAIEAAQAWWADQRRERQNALGEYILRILWTLRQEIRDGSVRDDEAVDRRIEETMGAYPGTWGLADLAYAKDMIWRVHYIGDVLEKHWPRD